jgi:nucleoporin NUP159
MAVSNLKGWFCAVTSSSIVFSPLNDLRLAFNSPNTLFSPKRSLSLATGASPTFVAYASADTKLVVAFDAGQLAVYDTSALFTPGSEIIHPLHSSDTHAGPFRQIAPNPGSEPGIIDTLAVVRGDGCVQLFNTNLESQGGWAGSDIDSTPVAGSSLSLFTRLP